MERSVILDKIRDSIVATVDDIVSFELSAQADLHEQIVAGKDSQIEALTSALDDCMSGEPNPDPDPDPVGGYLGHVPGRTVVGMCTQKENWETFSAEIGPLDARRFFFDGWDFAKVKAKAQEINAVGLVPTISLKLDQLRSSSNWRKAAEGGFDPGAQQIIDDLASLDFLVYIVVHHEPTGDGGDGPQWWAKMQVHFSNLFAGAANICFQVIMNGHVLGRYKDLDQLNAHVTLELIATLQTNRHKLAWDCYDQTGAGNRTSDKIRGCLEWSLEQGFTSVGLGEFGCLDAAELRVCADLILASDGAIGEAIYFDSEQNNRPGVNWTLHQNDGRLQEFQRLLTLSRA